MKQVYINNTFTETYLELIQELMKQGVTKAPRNQPISHLQNALFVVKDPSTVFSCESRKYNWTYLNKELELYFKGEKSAEKFGEASKFWLKLANAQNNINSSYGYRIFYRPIYSEIELNEKDVDLIHEYNNQWQFCKEQLINDKDTRQALMFVSGPDVQYKNNKDFICTLTYLFDINDNQLNLTVNRRSQDLHFGLPYDFVWEYLLLYKMKNELTEVYPDLKLGTYTMFANNVHIYERNFEIFKQMLDDYNTGKYENQNILNNITSDNLVLLNRNY
jgi:thymidylate synthase